MSAQAALLYRPEPDDLEQRGKAEIFYAAIRYLARETGLSWDQLQQTAIACGHYACVWAIPGLDNWLLKLSFDPNDLRILRKAQQLRMPGFVRLAYYFRLPRELPAYWYDDPKIVSPWPMEGAIVQKCVPIAEHWNTRKGLTDIVTFYANHLEWGLLEAESRLFQAVGYQPRRADAKNHIRRKESVRPILRGLRRMMGYGFEVRALHEGNIMQDARGDLVVTDAGQRSFHKLRPPPPFRARKWKAVYRRLQ